MEVEECLCCSGFTVVPFSKSVAQSMEAILASNPEQYSILHELFLMYSSCFHYAVFRLQDEAADEHDLPLSAIKRQWRATPASLFEARAYFLYRLSNLMRVYEHAEQSQCQLLGLLTHMVRAEFSGRLHGPSVEELLVDRSEAYGQAILRCPEQADYGTVVQALHSELIGILLYDQHHQPVPSGRMARFLLPMAGTGSHVQTEVAGIAEADVQAVVNSATPTERAVANAIADTMEFHRERINEASTQIAHEATEPFVDARPVLLTDAFEALAWTNALAGAEIGFTTQYLRAMELLFEAHKDLEVVSAEECRRILARSNE